MLVLFLIVYTLPKFVRYQNYTMVTALVLLHVCNAASLPSCDDNSYFEVIDASDCTYDNDCFTSTNFPIKYGANTNCKIQMCQDAYYFTNETFEVEEDYGSCPDWLKIDTTKYCHDNNYNPEISDDPGTKPPSTGFLQANTQIEFFTDYGI